MGSVSEISVRRISNVIIAKECKKCQPLKGVAAKADSYCNFRRRASPTLAYAGKLLTIAIASGKRQRAARMEA
jgi:hypothetical protein